jgi:hypothetical protein
MFGSAGCSVLRAEGFSCSLDVLYGGSGISKLKFLIFEIYFFQLYFFKFMSSKLGFGSASGSALI